MPYAVDDFGGVAVEEAPSGRDEFGGLPVEAGPDLSKIKLSPYDQAAIAAFRSGRGKPESGMESGTELTGAIASDPVGFAKSIPSIVGGVMMAPGKLAFAGAADLVSKGLSDYPGGSVDKQYGGNLAAMMRGEDQLPAEKMIGSAAQSAPNLAVTANVAKSLAEMAPMLGMAVLPATINRIAAGAFSLQMIAGVKAASRELGTELGKLEEDRDAGKIASLKSDLIQTGIFAPLAGAGAASGLIKPRGKFQGPLATGELLRGPKGAVPSPETQAAGAVSDQATDVDIAPPTTLAPSDLQAAADAMRELRNRPRAAPVAPEGVRTAPGAPEPIPAPPEEAAKPDISFLEKPMGSHGPEEIAAIPEDVWGAAMQKRKGIKWSQTADATAWAMNQKSTPELLARLKTMAELDAKEAMAKGEFPQKMQWYQDAAHALSGDEVGLANIANVKQMAEKGQIKIKPAAPTAPPAESQGPNQPWPELTPEQKTKQRNQSRRLVEERYRFASPEVLKLKLEEFDAQNAEPVIRESQTTPTPAPPVVKPEIVTAPDARVTPPPAAAPASSVGVSAPVDISKPAGPKRAYSGAAYQAPASEFVKLVKEHAMEHGWADNPDLLESGATGYAMITHNAEMAKAFRRAFKQLGIDTDRNTLRAKAEALPKLKAFLEAHAKTVETRLEDIPDGAEFTIAGEKFKVKGTNPDTELVTIVDGKTIKKHLGDSIKIDPGSLKKPAAEAEPVEVKSPWEMGFDELTKFLNDLVITPEGEYKLQKLYEGKVGERAPRNSRELVNTLAENYDNHPEDLREDFPKAIPSLELALPESIEQQKARMASEKATALKKSQGAAVQSGAAKPLVGAVGDIGQRDLLGGGDLFSQEPKPAAPEKGIASDWTSATDDTPPTKPGEEPPPTASLVNPPTGPTELQSGISIPKFANRKMSPLDRVTASHSGKLQKSFDEARRAQREIKADVPSERRQNAISIWREAKGDVGTLKGWASAAKGKLFKQAAIDAQTLTPKEIAVATKVGAAFDALHARGTKFDVLRSHRDAYVPHVWDVGKPGTGFGTGMLKQRFRFSKARTFDTFFDGDQAGFKPKTLAIGKLLPAYIHEMNTVIADRQAVRDIVAGTNKDGSPMAVPRGNSKVVEGDEGKAVLVQPRAMKGELDTSDYKTMSDQPALANWTWASKDTAGRPVFIKSDLALHPDAYRRINAMIGQSALRQWYHDPVSGTAQIPRALARGLDTAQSAMKREMFGLLAPFHQVQEGTHGIGHMVNPFSHIPKVDLRDPAQLDAANHGLMLLPDRASARVYLEGVGAHSSLLSQGIRKLGRPGEAISDVIDGYQDYLFHQYIPGLKFKTYQAILGRNMKRYAEELKSGEMTPADVKITSAEQSNAAYGHLNYALLDRNPTMQHLIQLGTLAPDFLEARGRFAGQAIKGLSSPVGAEQLKAIAILAAVQAGSAYIISNVTGGQYDPHHPFEVVHNGRRYAMRSVPEDIFSLLKDTRQFIYSRVNPLLVKGGIQLATGLNYRGEKTSPLDTFTELLATYIPITARQLPGLRSLTETSRQNPVSPLQQSAGALGLRISRYSPVSETYKLAGKWMDSQKMERSKGSYPISKYQQLRYALEDGDMDRAKIQYDALAKTTVPGKLRRGFRESIEHPFTGKKATDAAFAKTLSGYNLELYHQALRTRVNMLKAFDALPKGSGRTASNVPSWYETQP
jgi:hypothetical protein